MASEPRRVGTHVVITLPSTGPLRLPFASEEEAQQVVAKAMHAASLPGSIVSGAALHAGGAEHVSDLHTLEPLHHITDIDHLSADAAYHLLASAEMARQRGRLPRGYMLLPLPDNVWVEYGDRMLPGPVAVVAWTDDAPAAKPSDAPSRSSPDASEMAPPKKLQQHELDLDVILRRLRAKAEATQRAGP